MSSRFSSRADARDDLFSSYNRSASPSKSKNKARASPYNAGSGYGYTPPSSADGPGFGAYPGGAKGSGNGSLYPGSSSSAAGGGYGGYGVGGGGGGGGARGSDDGVYRAATPNSRGQYSAAVLDELESQNDEHVGVLTSKVKMLKDVRCSLFFCSLWKAVANIYIVDPSHRRRNPRFYNPG
jgi:blocked-early-in-transport protein 1